MTTIIKKKTNTPKPEVQPAPQINLHTPIVQIIQMHEERILKLEQRISNLENNNSLNINDL